MTCSLCSDEIEGMPIFDRGRYYDQGCWFLRFGSIGGVPCAITRLDSRRMTEGFSGAFGLARGRVARFASRPHGSCRRRNSG